MSLLTEARPVADGGTSGLAALYEADSRLKSGGTNQRAVMEFLVTQLAS